MRYLFTSSGRLTELRDRNDRRVVLSYVNGLLSIITDTVGRVISFDHNPDGLLERVTLPDGRSVRYDYENGRLSSVIDVRGGTTTYGYDYGSRLKQITDQNGNDVVYNGYDAAGRIIWQDDARGKTSWFSWDPVTQTSTMTDARGKS